MDFSEETIKAEQDYAAYAKAAISRCTEKELARLKDKRVQILEERKYFIDYFYELKEDEKRDLLENEFLDTKTYENTLADLARLGRQQMEPYFARFDFAETGESTEDKYYIGIHTVADPADNQVVIYDWRAPVASLYYENEPGPASYKAPGGVVEGKLNLKRRYVFKKGVLKHFNDISMPSDDELLTAVLQEKSNTHMKTILQTIQKEQHRIIRDYIEGISVIQGCPGSGKSSVALHKAAYVLYCFRERLKTQKIAIISPNDVFAEYISTVLPDLGEENIETILAEDIVGACLQEEADVRYLDRIGSREYYLGLSAEEQRQLSVLLTEKVGRGFREKILQHVADLENSIFTPTDLVLEDGTVCMTKEELFDLFYKDMRGIPLLSRPEAVTKYICDKKKYTSYEMREYIGDLLRGMMKSLYISELYRMMYPSGQEPEQFLWDDACAMALLKILLRGTESEYAIFYLIADEAQDFTPVFLEILNRKYRGCNMLFVGDRDQLVFGNSGTYLEDIRDIIQKKPFREYTLNTNYRSTAEIMKFALGIMGRKEDDSALCVRSGPVPQVVRTSAENLGKAVGNFVEEMYEKGYENIAVLCKSAESAAAASASIHMSTSVVSNINLKVLPIYLAKGLEFDAVAVWNADRKSYGEEGDKNLLYTAVTRAMHEVRAFFVDTCSPFLPVESS